METRTSSQSICWWTYQEYDEFPEYVECDNDVFTAEPEIMPDISNYLPNDETDDDDNESSKNEEQTTVPSFQSSTGLETVMRFFLCNEL